MKRSWWRTGPPIMHTQPVLRPTGVQLLRQIAVLFAIVAVWGGGFLILLDSTRSSNVAFVVETNTPASKRTSTTAASPPTNTPIPTATATPTLPNTVQIPVSFAHDVQPIFDRICVKCHGGERPQKNLVLKTFDDLMQGSEDGSVIEPGDPGNSLLIEMIVKGKMPKSGPRLLPAQIRTITEWVKEGALNN